MIKIENTVTPSPKQWEAIIRGMRNPMNSWDKSDSYTTHIENPETHNTADFEFFIGDADKELMMKLAKGGSVHAKYRRMIVVYVDITAPLYWWKEFDTYKVGTVANSCSTMHKIHAQPFFVDDFSNEHLSERDYASLTRTVNDLEYARNKYNETKDKKYWYDIIQLLPASYNQKRTIMLSYEVLVGMYRDRKNHKLQEWHEFCRWIEQLPNSEIIM